MKNVAKWLLAGIVVATVSYFINALFTILFKNFYAHTPELIKPLSNVWLVQTLLGNFSSGLIYALMFTVLQHGIPGKGISKGFFLGILLWAITVPPLLITYNTNLDTKLIMSWLLTGLVATPLACIAVVLIHEKITGPDIK
ncbi:MAG: hypothetical protein PHD29_03100 [bacterium]|nr:hypothetical protein [bacterium]MDD5353657.1 hypothetical protein [bacterium]MDD5756488.1 hypothetical protein [bacterium]